MESGADGDRTRDLHAASVALSQLSYGPNFAQVASLPLLDVDDKPPRLNPDLTTDYRGVVSWRRTLYPA
jgi:hypothetical protein